ncbi:MAG: transketolase [Synergistaceae bacterium]|jgi:transketolase|nr:transketolase [Synergistaceae bacterium]
MSLTAERKTYLDGLCGKFRRDVIDTLYAAQTGHPGGSLSVCEILTALYFEKARVDPSNPQKPDRDRIVLCKGHAAPMLYRVLAEKGFFPVEEMKTLRQLNTRLQGHPSIKHTPGVDLSTGPLGTGLSAALGMALGLRLSNTNAKVYAILGDGDVNEGTVWEACMSAVKFKANNLIAIYDWNKVQLDGKSADIMPQGDMAAKFSAFGWRCIPCDGHNVEALCEAIDKANAYPDDRPVIVLADTVKGKGVSFMEGQNAWHGKAIGESDHKRAVAELGGK